MGIMTDAAHGQHFTTGRGHYGIVMTFAGGYVCSRSSQIPMVTLSPMESEYYGMSEAITYAIWGRGLLAEIGYEQLNPTPLGGDNTSAISCMTKDGSFARTKHIRIRIRFTQEHENKTVATYWVPGDVQTADALTKPQTRKDLLAHMHAVGLRKLRES